MKRNFRDHHLFQILGLYDESILPLDVLLNHYFRKNTALGSKDRKFISETLYGIVRWKALLDYLSPSQSSWEKRIEVYNRIDPLNYIDDQTIPQHVRLSFPKNYFDLLQSVFDEDKVKRFCLSSNTRAPTTVRINLLKTTREAMFENWQKDYKVSPCRHSADGIVFQEKIQFFSLPEFKDGLFEIQDEGSQLIAQLVNAKPKEQILDYCSGSGGKTLGFAPQMDGKGQIYLHDIRPKALMEAKKRLNRAGIQNVQFLPIEKKHLYAKKLDAILLDVPCSGSGTLRRNPDMKWKFSQAIIDDLVQTQRSIVDEALYYLKPGGRIIYATCSVFPQENEEQVRYFEEKYDLVADTPYFQSFPEIGEMDGFFGAVLRKKFNSINT